MGYFRNIKESVATIFEGMSVTFSHFMRRPYTVQYPDRIPIRIQDTLPFRYRGILEVDLEICTGCLACERACPIDCIVIDAVKDKNTKAMMLNRFDIDIAKCMYKPKSGPETAPEVGPILDRGMAYLNDFATGGSEE